MLYFIGNTSLEDVIPVVSVQHCLDYFSNHESIAIDTETQGMNPHTKHVICLQIGDAQNQYVIDARTINILQFKELLESRLCIAQNAKFDYKFLKAAGINVERWWDTMLAEIVLMSGSKLGKYSLQDIALKHLGKYLPKDVRDTFHRMDSEPLSYAQIVYAGNDVAYLHQIKDKQTTLLEQFSLSKVLDLENEYLKVLGDIEYNGILIDADKWISETTNLEVKVIEKEKELDRELIDIYGYTEAPYSIKKVKRGRSVKTELMPYIPDMFNTYQVDRHTGVLWSSPKQVLGILNNILGIFPRDNAGKGTSNSTVLEKLRNPPFIVKLLIEHREISKLITTYGQDFIYKNRNRDGRIRCDFWQILTTGRVSSNHPNMQQIPADRRSCFIAGDDCKILTLDFVQQEVVVLADRSGEPELIRLYTEGIVDSHSLMATKIFKVPVSKQNNPYSTRFRDTYRNVGKKTNLALNYGMSALSFGSILGTTQQEAQELLDIDKESFPVKYAYFDQTFKETLEHGYYKIDDVIGRISWIPPDIYSEYIQLSRTPYLRKTNEQRSRYFRIGSEIYRNSMNYPIQGTAGNISKLAGVLIRGYLLKHISKAKIVNVVHDEYVLECDNQIVEEVAEECSILMTKAAGEYCKKVEMKVDVLIDKHWKK
uniref:Putative DNA polymerase n=1 Tax=viral metagenome TaxID=1070528 RepID=A0A6M3X848_9ZZZZ